MDLEDIIVWPDGTWCYVEEIDDMNHMSDDYQVIPFGSHEHSAIQSLEDF